MKHITKVRELYEETIHWISESEDSWKNFLSCMGRLYQLDFLNTCMVYAQRPDASVLAGYDAWLEMDLPVARGSKGIAVFPSKIFGEGVTHVYDIQDRWFMEEFYEPLMKWEEVYKSNPDNTEKTLFTDGYMDKGMMIIHKRLLTETPIQQYGMNGCCVPGQRRIYVTTKGEFLHCEKVGNIPCLGNVNEGFDKEKIKKLYVEDFIEEAKEYCKECWAVNLCTLCYVNCYDANGLHLSYRHNSCRNERKYLEDNLRRYHALMEANPSELEQYNEMEIH